MLISRPMRFIAVLMLASSLSACSHNDARHDLETELSSQLTTLESSFQRTMRTTPVAEWEGRMLDPQGGVVGERWAPNEIDADQVNVSGGIIVYDIKQSGNSITFNASLSTSTETGSGMLYKRVGAYVCVEMLAQYKPGEVTVEVEDSRCAAELESRLTGDVRYKLHELPGWEVDASGRPREGDPGVQVVRPA